MHPYVLAVTGASAQPLAERTLQLLLQAGRSVHLVPVSYTHLTLPTTMWV